MSYGRIGVIGAMDSELAALIAALAQPARETVQGLAFHTGRLGAREVVLVRCGIGKVSAARCTQVLIDRFAPAAVINTGIAGGLGAGLRAFCRAVPLSGAKLIIDMLELRKHLQNADLLITGEGCTDSQTESGKLCAEVAAAAKECSVPVLLLSGALKGDLSRFHQIFDCAFSTSSGAHASIAEAVRAGRSDLYFTALNIAKLINSGICKK